MEFDKWRICEQVRCISARLEEKRLLYVPLETQLIKETEIGQEYKGNLGHSIIVVEDLILAPKILHLYRSL